MPIPHLTDSKLICRFRGIIALFVEDGDTTFQAAIIKPVNTAKDIDGHEHKIRLFPPISGNRSIEPEPIVGKDILIEIAPPNNDEEPSTTEEAPGVELFRPERGDPALFDREAAVASFSWALDIENELYRDDRGNPRDVILNPAAIRSTVKFTGVQHAIFITSKHAEAPFFADDDSGEPRRKFENAAFEVTAEISLPTGRATIKVFDENSQQYEITHTLEIMDGQSRSIEIVNECKKNEKSSCTDNLIRTQVIEAYNGLISEVVNGTIRSFRVKDTQDSTGPAVCPLLKLRPSGSR